MSKLNELSADEIKSLEVVAACVRFIPRESRDAINHVLEIARSENKDEAEPKVNVGDRVETEEGMGTAKIVSDDGDFVVSRLDDGTCAISKNVPLSEKEEKPTAEDKEKSAQSRLVDTESPYTMMAILREEEEKRKEKNYRMELAAKIAIAYAERGHYEPWEIGAKAVEVANGVVDRLKDDKI